MKTVSVATVREQLSKFLDEVATTHERVTVTRNGTPVAVLISVDDLESMEETLYWAAQGRAADEADAPSVGAAVVAELAERVASEGDPAARPKDVKGWETSVGRDVVSHGSITKGADASSIQQTP